MTSDSITKRAVERYLERDSFNGLPVRELLMLASPSEVVGALRVAVERGQVSLNFGDGHPNTHIKAFEPDSREAQLEKLTKLEPASACIYPTPATLGAAVDERKYESRPFTKLLALGAPQLQYEVFDLSVLEAYRNDPRYLYDCNDVGGHLSIHDEYFESGRISSSDEVSVQFGFAYDEAMTRGVAAFLIDLSRLSPEHQQIWRSKQQTGTFHPHPGWWATQMGHWPERVSVFDAFIAEFEQIAAMCKLIGWEPVFRKTYSGERPRDFAFLIRPTLASFNGFIHLLDKMLSDNLSKDFFKGRGLSMEVDETRGDGKIVVRPKGTIQLLEEWFRTGFRPSDPAPLKEAVDTLKEVRRLRQKPAHAVDEDRFDPVYYQQQRDIVFRAYGAVRIIRLVLANHPKAKSHQVPDWLHEGRIWPF